MISDVEQIGHTAVTHAHTEQGYVFSSSGCGYGEEVNE